MRVDCPLETFMPVCVSEQVTVGYNCTCENKIKRNLKKSLKICVDISTEEFTAYN